jgi:hypothetical protein
MNNQTSFSLYDRDYYKWIQETIEKLKLQQFDMVDWENLIEEIEDMGRSEKHAVESFLLRLLEHLLKLNYWEGEKERNANHWASEIVNFRMQLKDRLAESPSLNSKIDSTYQRIYPTAKRAISKLFKLPDDAEITLDEALDDNFFKKESQH